MRCQMALIPPDNSIIYFIEIQFITMSLILIVIYGVFVMEKSVSHKMEAMRGFIFHQSNPPCRDVNTKNELKTCTLTNQKDYHKIMSINSNRSSPQGQMKLNCRDGSNNMTCLPLSLPAVSYFCACAAEKGDPSAGIDWDDTWEEITESGSSVVSVMHKLAGVWMECSWGT